MSDIFSQLITPQVRFVLVMILIFVALLYVLSIIWVIRDSYLRGTNSNVWGIVALIPFVGAMIYAMMRPPLYASDREEQNISLLLQQRELMDYGECPQCGYPTVRDYVLCPNCHTRLRNQCGHCGHTLEQEWSICPYCGTRADDSMRQDSRRAQNIRHRAVSGHAPAAGLEARRASASGSRTAQGKAASRDAHASEPHAGRSLSPSESGRLPRVVAQQRQSPSASQPAARRTTSAPQGRPPRGAGSRPANRQQRPSQKPADEGSQGQKPAAASDASSIESK
jgi:RNA polymerase subunit RPABC4/transcription elongation factor Spt4